MDNLEVKFNKALESHQKKDLKKRYNRRGEKR